MSTAFQFKFAGPVLLAAAGIPMLLAAGQSDNPPPKELVQYVHEAERRGVKEDKIKQQALAVGWPPGAVDQAIAYEKDGKSAQTASPEAVTATSQKPQPDPPEMQAANSMLPAADGLNPPVTPGGTPAPAIPNVTQDYQIAPGDTLAISVWGDVAASVPSEIVRPDGKISLPLIKEVEVAGLTPTQVEKVVTERLAKFQEGNVTVMVTAIAPKQVYLTGGVKKEGPIPFKDGMTVLQALSEAGGLTDYAKRNRIYVLHTQNGIQYRLEFNYNEVVKGVRMEQNYPLTPNDTVVVPH